MVSIRYTVMEATRFQTFEDAGFAADACQLEDTFYTFKMWPVSGGILVQVLEGHKNLGYLHYAV